MILSLINKGVIELLISILALIFSCIALLVEQRNMKKINRIGLESKFFLTLLESFIATELPEARIKIHYSGKVLENLPEFVDVISKIRRSLLFYKYLDKTFYDKVTDKLKEIEDFVVPYYEKIILDSDNYNFNSKLDNLMCSLYALIMNKYSGN